MYSEFYGLTGKPFQLTPDPRFYFDSQTHRKAMAYLGYGLVQGEGFIVITGDIGAGKTTLVGHLMATIDRSRLNAIQVASTQVGGDDMLRLAAQGLGVRTEGMEKAQLLDRIERALHEQARQGKRTLLIVDEAQNLPISALEELRMLSNFQSGGTALVQIFLLGQPEFRDKVQSEASLEQLRQRVIATHHLDPMNADEVEPYINHRLKLVGWDGRPRFDAGAYAALYRHSDGVPRRLNTLMDRVLLLASVEGLDEISEATIDSAFGDMVADGHGASAAPAKEGTPLNGTVAEPAAGERSRISFGDRRPTAVPLPPQPSFAPDQALTRRVAALEARIEEQDAVLRRVLTLLVQWVERDGVGHQRDTRRNSAA
ncbi:MAG: ral secretion pathway protein [Sphingomonas bacterium]|nr:ral secretion pathway protein [Sphingomonas bacterium]